MSLGEILFGKKEAAKPEQKLDISPLIAEIRESSKLNIEIKQLLAALHATRGAYVNTSTDRFTVYGNSGLTIEDVALGRTFIIPLSFRIMPAYDNYLTYYLYIDDQLRYVDTSVMMTTYANSFKMVEQGILFICRKVRHEFHNTTSTNTDVTLQVTYVNIDEAVKDKIDGFLSKIVEAIE